MLINWGANLLMSIANKDTLAKSLSAYKFIVSFDLFLTETSDFVDIVLPDCGYLQSVDSRANFPTIFSHPSSMGEWSWPIRQPVVPPIGEQRRFTDVLLELADRVGFLPDMLAAFNAALDLEPPHRLDVTRKYTYEEICDTELKHNFGDERGLDWFKENGLINWKKKPRGNLLAALPRCARADLLGVDGGAWRKDRRHRRAARPADSARVLQTDAGLAAVQIA